MGAHEFFTEEQQRSLQMRVFGRLVFPTPDVLLRQPVQLLGAPMPVQWLEVKNTVVFPGCTMARRAEHFHTQVRKYANELGTGTILWVNGYPHSLPGCKQVCFLQ